MKEFLTEKETEFLLENETRLLVFPANREVPTTTMRFIWVSYDCILEIGEYTEKELLETIWLHSRKNRIGLGQATYNVVSIFEMMSHEIYAEDNVIPKGDQYRNIGGVQLRGKRLILVGHFRICVD